MKFSVELPIANLEYSDRLDYDFIIASNCVKYFKYKNWYIDPSRSLGKHSGPTLERFRILDNGAFETGEAIDDMKYIDLARLLQPNVLVIPDVFKNSQKTIKRFREFMLLWDRYHIDGVELMGVIQADGSVDIAHKLTKSYAGLGIKWIGVPYVSGIDRYQFIKNHPNFKVHILGLPILPEIISLNTLPNVISVDSSLPVKVTKDQGYIDAQLCSNMYVQSDDDTLSKTILKYNLEMFRAICHGMCRIARI